MDRVFLDANVLFSAAYRPDSRLRALWESSDVELVSSEYAVDEARRNIQLAKPRNADGLQALTNCLAIIGGVGDADLPEGVHLHEKDRPILAAAIEAGASHFLTGDKTHFGHLFGRTVSGVLVLRPGEYLRGRQPGHEAVDE